MSAIILHYIKQLLSSYTSSPAMSSLSAECGIIRGPLPKRFLSYCKCVCFLKSPPHKERCLFIGLMLIQYAGNGFAYIPGIFLIGGG